MDLACANLPSFRGWAIAGLALLAVLGFGAVNAASASAQGSISGTVTADGGATLLEGAEVTAVPRDEIITGALDEAEAGDEVAPAEATVGNGTYTITGLAPGEYVVRFDAGTAGEYATEFYNDTPDPQAAQIINVQTGPIININADLELGGTISGTVTAEDGGLGAANVCVRAFPIFPSFDPEPVLTEADGSYEISRLPAGSYRLLFDPCENGGNLIAEWWNDKPTPIDATPIEVTAGGTDDADAILSTGGSISGTVTGDGTAIVGATVRVYGDAPEPTEVRTTGGGGAYTVDQLPDGDYKVEVAADGHTPEFYDGASGASTIDLALPVPVDAPNPVLGIDLDLSADGVPPLVTIATFGSPTTDTTPSFGFTIDDPTATAQCSFALSDAPIAFGPCTDVDGHQILDPVAVGTYTFAVRATDPANNTHQATAEIVIEAAPPPPPPPPPPPETPGDTTAPSIKITSGPAGKITDRRPRFGFSSEDPTASFLCSLDGGAEAPCTSPTRTKKLKNGKHTFAVTAVDQAGNRATETRPFKVKVKKKKKRRR